MKDTSGQKRTILENKRAILGIKEHFWEVTGHIKLRIRALGTLPPPAPFWSGHFCMFQARGALFSHLSDIQILKIPKYPVLHYYQQHQFHLYTNSTNFLMSLDIYYYILTKNTSRSSGLSIKVFLIFDMHDLI